MGSRVAQEQMKLIRIALDRPVSTALRRAPRLVCSRSAVAKIAKLEAPVAADVLAFTRKSAYRQLWANIYGQAREGETFAALRFYKVQLTVKPDPLALPYELHDEMLMKLDAQGFRSFIFDRNEAELHVWVEWDKPREPKPA